MEASILVVDDESTLRSVVGEVLREDGHHVQEAASGEEALELFQATRFPLVLTDVIMGRMSGLDLLREIKLQEPETVVVVMTSQATLDTAVQALRSGAYDFLIKPFDDIDLVSAVVHRALDRIKLIRHNAELLERTKRYAAKLEALNERLHTMANQDGLTGLYNHRYFRQSLDRELARAARYDSTFSLVFIDIDHFKRYNDLHGHLGGDTLLRALGQLLKSSSRKSDVAARYGGEEFVLLLPETDRAGALRFARHLQDELRAQRFSDERGNDLEPVTLSLGIACYPGDATAADAIIECADRALYRAKQDGRDRVRCWGEHAGPGPAGGDRPAGITQSDGSTGGDP